MSFGNRLCAPKPLNLPTSGYRGGGDVNRYRLPRPVGAYLLGADIPAGRAAQSYDRPARPAAQRTRFFVAAGSIVVVAAIVLTFVPIKLNAKTTPPSDSSIPNGHAGAAPTAVVDNVTSVPASTLNTVGSGGSPERSTITGNPAPLTANGKPELLYSAPSSAPTARPSAGR